MGALVDQFAADGIAIDVDRAGRLSVASAVAERMRDERAEAERKAAEEAAEAARVAAEEAAAQEAVWRVEAERQRRYNERVRRLTAATGLNMIELEMQMRRELINKPDTGMSHAHRLEAEDRGFTLAKVDAWVLETYGTGIFDFDQAEPNA